MAHSLEEGTDAGRERGALTGFPLGDCSLPCRRRSSSRWAASRSRSLFCRTYSEGSNLLADAGLLLGRLVGRDTSADRDRSCCPGCGPPQARAAAGEASLLWYALRAGEAPREPRGVAPRLPSVP